MTTAVNARPKPDATAAPARSLDDHVSRLPGVSAGLAALLGKGLGILTVRDLLHHFPRRYEDRAHFKLIRDIRHGEAVTIRAKVTGTENVPTRGRLTITKVTLNDGSGNATLVFFNQWYLKKQFDKLRGESIVCYGKASRSGWDRVELSDVEWEAVSEEIDSLAMGRIVPIYPGTEGVTQARLRRAVYAALSGYGDLFEEYLPLTLRRDQDLMPLPDAVRALHFPEDEASLEAARQRFVFDEFFNLQLVLAARRRKAEQITGTSFRDTVGPIRELVAALPFILTDAQKRVIKEVAADMRAFRPMHRLVQGDVGSGKTVIAMAALLVAVRNGYQAVLMAPTEILAEQHYLGIKKILEGLGVSIAPLSGSMPAKEKRAALAGIADGTVDIAVGTHALIQSGVEFHKLGLAVVDEQHRFGVMQRTALKDKGARADVLVMTATPIPRSLTLTVYGDLDVSILDQSPPGRKPVRTHWKRGSERAQVYETLRRLLQEGRQAYVICSLIEESEKLQARAATELAEHLQNEVFSEFSVGLLHGQMKTAEKEEVMTRFRDRSLQVLVSTTVIEVGVDVPNASVIVIEDADRFGMAQLHQLRGRVGRGETQSYCLLIADAKTDEGVERLQTIASTTDGFKIAEQDLRLRGPGDFFGIRQSGVIGGLPFLDVIKDVPILDEARRAAFELLESDPHLASAENLGVKKMALSRMKQAQELSAG